MTRIVVVSIGPGNVGYITEAAKKRLQGSDLVLGSIRQVEDIKNISSQNCYFHIYKKITEIETVIEENPKKQIRSEEHTSELQSRQYLVCRLLLEKKKA